MKRRLYIISTITLAHAVFTYGLLVWTSLAFVKLFVGAETNWWDTAAAWLLSAMIFPLRPIVMLIPELEGGVLLQPLGTVIIVANSILWAIGIYYLGGFIRNRMAA